MKGLKLSCLCCIFTFVVVAFADEITVTLQNGLNSYDGCEDAWVYGAYFNYNNERNTNYGNETKMSVFYGRDGGEPIREST